MDGAYCILKLICHLNEIVISLGAGMFLTEQVASPHGIVIVVVFIICEICTSLFMSVMPNSTASAVFGMVQGQRWASES